MLSLGAAPGRAARGAATTAARCPPPIRPRPLLLARRRPPARATPPTDGGPSSTTTTTTTTTTTPPKIIIPQSIHDVDNGRILGFGPDLAPDHPGYGDESYKQRRAAIARLALSHVPESPVPEIQYTPAEQATWRAVLERLNSDSFLPKHACREYLNAVHRLGFSPERVPQLRDVDEILQRESPGGWRIRPVAGLMHPRDFLAGLAFRTFHSTQYCRHPSQPQYTPEPDVVHELVGHVPMLLCPAYARMAENIGKASLGADDKKLWHLIKVYWYSVEFGVVWETDDEDDKDAGGTGATATGSAKTGKKRLKAFGAGILSSSAELEWMGQGAAWHEEEKEREEKGEGASAASRREPPPYEVVPLDPRKPLPRMSYKDGVQRRYYSLESFDQGARLLEDYALEAGPAPLAAGGSGGSGSDGSDGEGAAAAAARMSAR